MTPARIGQLAAVAALIVAVAATSSPILASPPRQAVPRLDGVQIYFSEDNKEASPFDRSERGLSRLAGVLESLGATVNSLDWRRDIPSDVDVVVIAAPVKDLDDWQSARLWVYLKNGGALLVLADPLTPATDADGNPTLEANKALRPDRGLFGLTWQDYGVMAREDVVVRARGAQLSPDFETTDFAANQPIAQGLTAGVVFAGARSVQFDGSIQNYVALPLIFSDPAAYGESAYLDYLATGRSSVDPESDTPAGRLALAVASEDRASGSRLVVIGDGDFATNGGGLRTSPPYSAGFVYPGNLEFLLRALAWLVDADLSATTELAFPTAAPTATPGPALPGGESPTAAPTATPAVAAPSATATAAPSPTAATG